MMWKNILLLLLALAVIDLNTSASIGDPTTPSATAVAAGELTESLHSVADTSVDETDVFNEDDDDEDDSIDFIDPVTVLDGIPLSELDPQELELLLNEDDKLFEYEIDIAVMKEEVLNRKSKDSLAEGALSRHKRWISFAFRAATYLFRAAARRGITSSGSRITRHYVRRGSYNSAIRDFNRFRPSGQNRFSGRVSGRTGTVGNHRITVRNSSSNGRPTLEIRSLRSNGSTMVRKFRYY